MPKGTLALKAPVTRRQAEAVPSDMAERLQQLRDKEPAPYVVDSVESPAREAEAESTPSQEKSRKQLKREAVAVQSAFLAGNLNKPVMIFLVNGLRLTSKLRQFDQFTLLLEGQDGICFLVFKHAVTTVTPACEQTTITQ